MYTSILTRVSTREVRSQLSDLLGRVFFRKEAVLVERNGKPYAVVISPQEYEMLERTREKAWATVDQVRAQNAQYSEDEILADVTAEVEAARQRRYEESDKSKSRN